MFSKNDKIYKTATKSLLEIASGGFSKRVFVVVQMEPEHPGNLDFLKKILLASGLDFEKDTLFAETKDAEPTTILSVLKSKHPDQVLVFGVSPGQIGLNIQAPYYRPVVFCGTTFLFSEKLSAIESDKTRKTNLWQALRHMFL